MRSIFRGFVLGLALLFTGTVSAQAPVYQLSFGTSPIPNLPVSSSVLVTVFINHINSNVGLLDTRGINGASIALRLSDSSVGITELTNKSAPSVADITASAGFNGTITRYAFDDVDISTVSGFTTNMAGVTVSRSGTGGVTTPDGLNTTLLPLATFRLTGVSVGSVTIQANLRDFDIDIPGNFVFGAPNTPFGDLVAPGTATFNVINAVPEPATWALIFGSITSGLGSVVWYRRRLHRQAEAMMNQDDAEQTPVS